jgi:hypothetical protein
VPNSKPVATSSEHYAKSDLAELSFPPHAVPLGRRQTPLANRRRQGEERAHPATDFVAGIDAHFAMRYVTIHNVTLFDNTEQYQNPRYSYLYD